MKKNFISTNDMENGKNHEGRMELTAICEAVFLGSAVSPTNSSLPQPPPNLPATASLPLRDTPEHNLGGPSTPSWTSQHVVW